MLHGVPWVHVAPAILAVLFAFLYLKTKLNYLKVFFGIIWLLLVPNTAYVFTDVTRMVFHWNQSNFETRIVLIIQYILLEIIGLVTFLVAMLPFESIIRAKQLSKNAQILAIILFNFLIGFGMILGRTGYTNSYVAFTQPSKVFSAAINIVNSFNLLVLAILFGMLCTCIYLLFRNWLLNYIERQKLL